VDHHDLHQRETILEQVSPPFISPYLCHLHLLNPYNIYYNTLSPVQIEYFEHARGEVALKKKAIVREIRQHKNLSKGVRRKSNFDEMQRSTTADSISDSESDQSEQEEEVEISAPVMHFINALARKTVLTGQIVREGELSFDEVRCVCVLCVYLYCMCIDMCIKVCIKPSLSIL
jgi:hypothetical protein